MPNPITSAQKATLKTAILADPTATALLTNGDLQGLADWCNTVAAPAFWVWRTNVSRRDVYSQQNDLTVGGSQTGFWRWDTYKAQAATEQNAWTQMFMGDEVDFSKQNMRDGVVAIFTGNAAQAAQQAHVLAVARRLATRAEKFLATGAGTTLAPAVMNFEGTLGTGDLVGPPFQG